MKNQINKLLISILFLAALNSCAQLRNAEKATNQAGKGVSFEFYSSCEKRVQLAYTDTIKENWQFAEMKKDGNRFYTSLKTDKKIWYEFVADTNVWFKKDPLNSVIDYDHPFIPGKAEGRVQNRNIETRYASSKHFDLFTTKDTADINALESLYNKLTGDVLKFLNDDLHPIHNKKIRYYSGIYKGMYAYSGSAEVVDDSNVLNSHELIHILLYKYPKFPPFTEGIAQCFQERGNKFPLVERGCNMGAKQSVSQLDLYDVLKDWNNHKNYHMAGSFIFYNLFVKKDTRENFITLIKNLTEANATFDRFESLFFLFMQKDLKKATEEWRDWIINIEDTPAVYVSWN